MSEGKQELEEKKEVDSLVSQESGLSSKIASKKHSITFGKTENLENDNSLLNTSFGTRRSSRLFSLSREGLVRVEYYGGGPNVDRWIRRFSSGAEAEELDSRSQLDLLSTLLVGKAATWWDVFGSKSGNIEDALDGLSKAFGVTEKRSLLLLLPQKKQFSQPVDVYGWELVKLCKNISSEMPESEIIDWFILGLNYEIRSKLLHQHFDSFIQALHTAQSFESERQVLKKKKVFIKKDNNHGTPMVPQNEKQIAVNKISKEERKCFKCGKVGHIKKDCYSKNSVKQQKKV